MGDSCSSNDSSSGDNSDGTDSNKGGDRRSNTDYSNDGHDGSTDNSDDVGDVDDGDTSSRMRTRLQRGSMAKRSANELHTDQRAAARSNSNRTNSLRGSADISINAAAANRRPKAWSFIEKMTQTH